LTKFERYIYIFKYEYHETIEISRTCVIKTVEEDERGRQMARYVETPVDDDIEPTHHMSMDYEPRIVI